MSRYWFNHLNCFSLKVNVTLSFSLEVLWHEKDEKASFINLSCLPAFLTSSCLHKVSTLSQISKQRKPSINVRLSFYISFPLCIIQLTARFFSQICRVKLDEIHQCHSINTRLSHSVCGHFIDEDSPLHGGNLHCSFCRVTLNSKGGSEVVRTFHIIITLADEETTKLYAWCTGQSASAILQISPDEFCDLPEVNKTFSSFFCVCLVIKDLWQ